MNIGILGLGEVGGAIKKLIGTKYSVFSRELTFDEIASHPIQILHICIPFTEKFELIVTGIIQELNPSLTIINSTVKPGTTQKIFHKLKTDIVHSPFMGVHPQKPKGQFIHQTGCPLPQMFDYFKKFPKVIGPVNSSSSNKADRHFKSLGLKTLIFDSPLETEMAKILDTTYYGWNIIFEKWVYQLCQQNHANFNQVYTQYNHLYNQGYRKDLPHVLRPNLQHHQGEIGGHCVIPNAQIIQDWVHDDFTQFLLKQNHKLARPSSVNKRQPSP